LGLRQRGFEWARVNLKKQVALFHHAALLIIARNDVALYLRVDVGVDEAIQRGDAFQYTRHIPRRDGRYQNFWRRRARLRGLARTTRGEAQTDHEHAENRKLFHHLIIADRE